MGKIILLQYTDAHGRFLSLMPQDEGLREKGLDRLLTRIKELKAQHIPYLLIDNGDCIQGTPLVDLYSHFPELNQHPHPLTLLHQHLGVHAFVPGNHEFNHGAPLLERLAQETETRWLSANILRQGKPLFEPYHLFEVGGLRIGLLGLITEYTPKWESPHHIQGLQFAPILPIAAQYLPQLRQECDFLVVSYHGGISYDPNTQERYCTNEVENQAAQLLEQHPEIDLILLGHQHRRIVFQKPGQALILQPSCHARCWSEIELLHEAGHITRFEAKIQDAEAYPPDPALTQPFLPQLSFLKNLLQKPLGQVGPEWAVSDPMSQVWLKKHPLIQWINELMMRHTGAKIAASSLLDIDVKGLPPEVTLRDLLTTYFFQDSVTVLELSGEVLYQAMEQLASFFELVGPGQVQVNPQWAGIKIRSYNYDIFDGIEYSFDIRRPLGSRVTKLWYQGRPIEPHETFPVALTTYRAGGGYFQMYEGCKVLGLYPELLTDLMMEDLQRQGKVKVQLQQNFQIQF